MFKILSSTLKKDSFSVINTFYCYQTVKLCSSVVLDEDLAKRLETVSLVGFTKNCGFEVLSASVQFADRITHIDTTKIQPLVTVLETWYVKLSYIGFYIICNRSVQKYSMDLHFC